MGKVVIRGKIQDGRRFFYENMKTTFLVQNIADFKVWTLYTYVFMGKESIFGVVFVIWPLNRKIGAKMTLVWVKIGPKSTFLDITCEHRRNFAQ